MNETRRKVIGIDPDAILAMFNSKCKTVCLPRFKLDGMSLLGTCYEFSRDQILFKVTHPDFPEVFAGCHPEFIEADYEMIDIQPDKKRIEQLEAELEIIAQLEDGAIIFNQTNKIDEKDGRIAELEAAINETLKDNAHLADGDDCTLFKLKQVMPESE